MFYLIYISTAVKLMNEAELLEVLTAARDKNSKHNVTGMLLYSEGIFMQALEGSEDDVKEIYESIKNDKRHKNIIKLVSGEITERNFPYWSMAFASVNTKVLNQIQSYTNPAGKDFLDNEANNTAIHMLKTFAEANNLLPR